MDSFIEEVFELEHTRNFTKQLRKFYIQGKKRQIKIN